MLGPSCPHVQTAHWIMMQPRWLHSVRGSDEVSPPCADTVESRLHALLTAHLGDDSEDSLEAQLAMTDENVKKEHQSVAAVSISNRVQIQSMECMCEYLNEEFFDRA
jgi:hypothetical protein